MANVDIDIFDSAFVGAIRHFQLSFEPCALTPDCIKTRVGLLHFLTPHQQAVNYIKRIANDMVVLSQEIVGETDTERQAKSLGLCHAGCLDSLFH